MGFSKMKPIGIVLLALFCGVSLAVAVEDGEENRNREKKLLSLFSVVTFKNDGCSSSKDTGRNGTCFTMTECSTKGGSAYGNCASGFGVCCVFEVQSASTTISQNCTYIQNPSYPAVYSATTSLSYTINKCADSVCAVRLDFDSFTTQGPAATDETSGGLCVDSFVASVTPKSYSSPVICGKNTGQHIYVDMGRSSGATATLDFTFATSASTIRTWDIKVTQIPCASSVRPTSGCLQYHQGLTGRLTTFNFLETTTPSHLATQDYSICIRLEKGMCCVKYNLCSDANSWSIDAVIASKAEVDNQCITDYIGISSVTHSCPTAPGVDLHSRMCGPVWNLEEDVAVNQGSVCDCEGPFSVDIKTDAAQESSTTVQRGVCLEYTQVAC